MNHELDLDEIIARTRTKASPTPTTAEESKALLQSLDASLNSLNLPPPFDHETDEDELENASIHAEEEMDSQLLNEVQRLVKSRSEGKLHGASDGDSSVNDQSEEVKEEQSAPVKVDTTTTEETSLQAPQQQQQQQPPPETPVLTPAIKFKQATKKIIAAQRTSKLRSEEIDPHAKFIPSSIDKALWEAIGKKIAIAKESGDNVDCKNIDIDLYSCVSLSLSLSVLSIQYSHHLSFHTSYILSFTVYLHQYTPKPFTMHSNPLKNTTSPHRNVVNSSPSIYTPLFNFYSVLHRRNECGIPNVINLVYRKWIM